MTATDPSELDPLFTAIDVQRHGDEVVLVVRGSLDVACAARFDSAVAGAFELCDACAIDVTSMTFIDSTGLRCLVRARRLADTDGRRLRIVGPLQPVPRRAFDITGLSDYLLRE